MDTVMGEGDQLIGITADDDTFVTNGTRDSTGAARSPAGAESDIRPERILIFGWNELGPRVLEELDNHLAPDSAVRVIVDPGMVHDRDIQAMDRRGRVPVTVREADTARGGAVVSAIEEAEPDHIVILCYRRDLTEAGADAHSLMTLLHVHRFLGERAELRERISVVVELLEVQDVALAKLIGAHDFIVSERLVSLLMAQLAENASMDRVFADLLDADGAEISFRPTSLYLPLGADVDFAAAVAAARDREEVAIGYRLASDASASGAGVVINPPKSARLVAGPEDRLLVLSHAMPHTRRQWPPEQA